MSIPSPFIPLPGSFNGRPFSPLLAGTINIDSLVVEQGRFSDFWSKFSKSEHWWQKQRLESAFKDLQRSLSWWRRSVGGDLQFDWCTSASDHLAWVAFKLGGEMIAQIICFQNWPCLEYVERWKVGWNDCDEKCTVECYFGKSPEKKHPCFWALL